MLKIRKPYQDFEDVDNNSSQDGDISYSDDIANEDSRDLDYELQQQHADHSYSFTQSLVNFFKYGFKLSSPNPFDELISYKFIQFLILCGAIIILALTNHQEFMHFYSMYWKPYNITLDFLYPIYTSHINLAFIIPISILFVGISVYIYAFSNAHLSTYAINYIEQMEWVILLFDVPICCATIQSSHYYILKAHLHRPAHYYDGNFEFCEFETFCRHTYQQMYHFITITISFLTNFSIPSIILLILFIICLIPSYTVKIRCLKRVRYYSWYASLIVILRSITFILIFITPYHLLFTIAYIAFFEYVSYFENVGYVSTLNWSN